MKYILILMGFMLSGCSKPSDDAKHLQNIIDECPSGSTVSFYVELGAFGWWVGSNCSWVKVEN